MRKRILTLATLSVLLVTAFVACSKDKDNTPDITPTTSASENKNDNNASDSEKTELESITFGGDFARDNGNLSFYISDSGWNVTGYHSGNENSVAPVVINGAITLSTNGPVFVYSDEENEVSFTYAADSLTVAVTKGTTYKIFEGTFRRMTQTTPAPEIFYPEKNSSLELIGRIALTHYMTKTEGHSNCMINFSETTFDNAYMNDFLVAYGNLFLSSEVTIIPEVSETSLVCGISKDDLNDLLLTVSAGTFDVSDFDGSAKNIVAKNDMFYIPCDGSFAGGLVSEKADPELISDALVMGGVVVKKDGIRYDVTMTLTTTKDSSTGKSGVRINTVTYTLAQ